MGRALTSFSSSALADAGVLLLLEGDLQQQQLPLQPRLRVQEGRSVPGFSQRLLPHGRKGKRGDGLLGSWDGGAFAEATNWFFVRATAPLGAVELEAAEHLDVVKNRPVPFRRVMGKVAQLPYRQGKKKKKGDKLKAAACKRCAGVSLGRASLGCPRYRSLMPKPIAPALKIVQLNR